MRKVPGAKVLECIPFEPWCPPLIASARHRTKARSAPSWTLAYAPARRHQGTLGTQALPVHLLGELGAARAERALVRVPRCYVPSCASARCQGARMHPIRAVVSAPDSIGPPSHQGTLGTLCTLRTRT